jgi:PAS domain S-box-containing protein
MQNLLLSISKANNHLLKEQSIDNALNFCITDIGKGQDIDRCYIFKNETENGILKLYYTHEWCNDDIVPYIDSPELNGIPYDVFPGLLETLSKDESMHGLVRESDNDFFRETMEMQDIKSYLFTPIFSNNQFWGWIGYDDCKTERRWTEEEVYALHSIAKNIGIRLNQDKIIAKLESTLEKFDFYMEGSKQAMWEWNLETDVTNFSYNWEGILGYKENEMIQNLEFWKKNIYPEDLIQIELKLKNYIEGKSDSYKGTARMIHKDGHLVWIKYSGLIRKNKDGKPIKIIGTYIDISEIKEAENQLELSEEKFRFIAENTTDLICQHSIDLNYTYVSSSCEEILGYKPEELLNKKPIEFIHPDDIELVKNHHENLIKHSKNPIVNFRYRKKDGSYIWLEAQIKLIFDEKNKIIGIQSCNRDISERIKAAEEMETALLKERKFNELKSKFVSMASHQFRTPLTVIYSNAELLEMKVQKMENKLTKSINLISERIKSEVERMTELMNNILVFGKYELQETKKDIKSIDFTDFIEKLIETYFNNEPDDRKIKLCVEGEKRHFLTDETLMLHIITNLISNAFKYSEKKPEPQITIKYLSTEIQIEIKDHGIGIPEKDIQNLYTSFFRAKNTSTIKGSGLGLVIVKQFTEFLNGTITLNSKENIGTTIILNFPYEQE